MQAVIMCAGKSSRTMPLTLTTPKPLLKIANKAIIDRNLDQLDGLVEEVIIILGYKADMIKSHLKDYKKIKIKYVTQAKQEGTGHALKITEKLIKGKFVLLNGDDLYSGKDIKNCLKHRFCLLTKKVEDISRFGAVISSKGILKEIVEKPKKKISDEANTGCYVFDKKIFAYLRRIKPSERGELEIIDAIKLLSKDEKVNVESVSDYWLSTSYPWNVLESSEFFLSSMVKKSADFILAKSQQQKKQSESNIEEGAHIKGSVSVGRGTIIKSGAYIQGPAIIGDNCIIGPNSFISYSVVGNDCFVSSSCSIKNSVLFDNVKVEHSSSINYSVLGNNSKIKEHVVVLSEYSSKPGETVKSMVNGILINSFREQLGCILGDFSILNAGSITFPGVKVWSFRETKVNEVIQGDFV